MQETRPSGDSHWYIASTAQGREQGIRRSGCRLISVPALACEICRPSGTREEPGERCLTDPNNQFSMDVSCIRSRENDHCHAPADWTMIDVARNAKAITTSMEPYQKRCTDTSTNFHVRCFDRYAFGSRIVQVASYIRAECSLNLYRLPKPQIDSISDVYSTPRYLPNGEWKISATPLLPGHEDTGRVTASWPRY